MIARLPRPHLGELLLLATLLVVLGEACRGLRSPEPAELAEARALVLGAQLALPAARRACPATPDPGACSGIADALDDALAILEPQLVACEGEAASTERQACEVERLEEVRKRLPELRRLVGLVGQLAQGKAPRSAPPKASSSTAPSAPAAPNAPERTP